MIIHNHRCIVSRNLVARIIWIFIRQVLRFTFPIFHQILRKNFSQVLSNNVVISLKALNFSRMFLYFISILTILNNCSLLSLLFMIITYHYLSTIITYHLSFYEYFYNLNYNNFQKKRIYSYFVFQYTLKLKPMFSY